MISGKLKENLVAEMQVREHVILSGLAAKLGGQDEAADPHELLEASLAACTILTAQLYARRKGYKLESTDVVVRILSEGAETRIAREVTYRGDLTEEEKTKITEIIDKCPIHRLLESKVSIETSVKA